VRDILVFDGGYAGFYAAWKLERSLRPSEATITLVEPRPYMTYQPFLPEVLAGSIEARHAAVSLRRHLRRTSILTGWVTSIDHARKIATVLTPDRKAFAKSYDIVVVTAGVVTRRFPIPGIAEQAIGLKHVEEAVAIRDRLLVAFDRASTLPAGPERSKLLTVIFVGGGFTGVEGFGELLSLADDLVALYPEIRRTDVNFHLVEASNRLLPEVSAKTARWVVREFRRRGALVHLTAQVRSAVDGHVKLSTGDQYDSGLIVWAAGNAANPLVAKHTDLPVDDLGRLVVRADLRVGTDEAPIRDAWGAGDGAAVPDLTSRTPETVTVPNAQHAVRQGKRLAANMTADIRGRPTRPYRHRTLGVVATLGFGRGVFQSGPIVLRGFSAWLLHRGYHVLAVPTWERKVRVLADWLPAATYGRDIVSLQLVQQPRAAFVSGGIASLVLDPEQVSGVWS
jgi:NADH dehydrogenase